MNPMPLEPGLCPACGTPRSEGPDCPRCGVIYARARPRAISALPTTIAGPSSTGPWQGDFEDAEWERAFRKFALPIALVGAYGLAKTGMFHALIRIFFT